MAPSQKRVPLRHRTVKFSAPNSSLPYNPHTFTNSSDGTPARQISDFIPSNEDGSFRTSKKDKRMIKHNALLAKVKDAGVKKQKRRRPNKKLKADLDGLADALPDLGVDLPEVGAKGNGNSRSDDDEWYGIPSSGDEGTMAVDELSGLRKRKLRKRAGERKMVMQSLKHKPGAMKKKRLMEGREMERFGRNLAQLNGNVKVVGETGKGGQQEAAHSDRWAALRSFIGGTMEKDKAFASAT